MKARGDQRLAAVPRDLEGSDLEELYERANPSAAQAMTFYRTVGAAAISEAVAVVGQSPTRCGDYKGDFAVDGGFYMFADKTEAEHVSRRS